MKMPESQFFTSHLQARHVEHIFLFNAFKPHWLTPKLCIYIKKQKKKPKTGKREQSGKNN